MKRALLALAFGTALSALFAYGAMGDGVTAQPAEEVVAAS